MTATTINKPDIISIIEGEGIQLKHRGRNFVALCPFHVEETPSFTVNPDRQIFRCFGCGIGGDVIDFIRMYKGLSFKGALSYLGIANNNFRADKSETKRRELVRKFRLWCDDYIKMCLEIIRLCNRINAHIDAPEDLELEGIEQVFFQREIYLYHVDILQGKNDESKFELFEEVTGYDTV